MPPRPGQGGRHRKRYAALRQAILDDLGPTQRIEIRRRMARFLRELADELDEPQIKPGPGGPPGTGIRWNGADLLIGQALWRELGSPRRVQLEFAGPITRIRATPNGDFYIRTFGRLEPRIACRRIYDQALWAEGWRSGRVEGGAIVFDIEATEP